MTVTRFIMGSTSDIQRTTDKLILFINGTVNSGKSTVSKILQERLGRAALVEIDDLRHMIQWMPLREAIPLNLKNALALVRTFAAEGLHVVVPYPLSRENHRYIVDELAKDGLEAFFFTIDPGKKLASADRGGRILSDHEKRRVEEQYAKDIHRPDFGLVIDTSEDTPEQTAERILSAARFDNPSISR